MAQAPSVDEYGNPVYDPVNNYAEEGYYGGESPNNTRPNDMATSIPFAPPPATTPAAPKGQWNDRMVEDWRNTGGTTRQQLEDYYNTHWKDLGVSLLKNDKIRSPGGREFDLIGNFGTPEAQARTGYTTDLRYSSGAKPQGNAVPSKSSSKASTAASTKTTAGFVAPAAPAKTAAELQAESDKSAQDQAISDAIMRLLGRGEKPVTEGDVGAQYGGLSATMQRGAERAKAEAAERQAFQGTSFGGAGGALDTEQRGISEDLALGEGEIMAKLMGDEIEARRADVVNALGFAQGEQKIRLTAQLAEMDDALERLKLQQQESQFGRSLSENSRQFDVGEAGVNRRFNLGEAGTNARFGSTMDYNYDRFGFDKAVYENEVNDKIKTGLA